VLKEPFYFEEEDQVIMMKRTTMKKRTHVKRSDNYDVWSILYF
jgi:hypothetical protein